MVNQASESGDPHHGGQSVDSARWTPLNELGTLIDESGDPRHITHNCGLCAVHHHSTLLVELKYCRTEIFWKYSRACTTECPKVGNHSKVARCQTPHGEPSLDDSVTLMSERGGLGWLEPSQAKLIRVRLIRIKADEPCVTVSLYLSICIFLYIFSYFAIFQVYTFALCILYVYFIHVYLLIIE